LEFAPAGCRDDYCALLPYFGRAVQGRGEKISPVEDAWPRLPSSSAETVHPLLGLFTLEQETRAGRAPERPGKRTCARAL